MNQKKTILLALSSLFLLSGCGDGGNQLPPLDPAENVFDNGKVYFEAGSEENVSVKVEIKGDISSVSCGRSKAEAGQYSYQDGVLTLGREFLKSITAGEKDIRVSASKSVSIPSLVCT